MKKTFSFPRLGKYTKVLEDSFKEIGLNIIIAPKTTKKTVELGVKYSPEMQCIPFKHNLGNFIEVLEKNKDKKITLLYFANCGMCRCHSFHVILRRILTDTDYDFDMNVVHMQSVVKDLKRITMASLWQIFKALRKAWTTLKRIEKEEEINNKGDIKIGIFGEFFTVNTPECNLNLFEKLRDLGCYIENGISISWLVKNSLHLNILDKRAIKRKAKRLFPVKIGGHAKESIVSMIDFCERKFDGCIFLKPLTCMPETNIEPIILHLSKKYRMNLLILNFDENNYETLLDTQLDTFCEMIRRKK